MTTKKTAKIVKKAAKKPAKQQLVKPVVAYIQSTHVNNAAFSETRPGLLSWLYRTLYFAAPERGGKGHTKKELIAMALAVPEFIARYNDDVEIAGSKMKVTISAQVPSQFKSERGYIVKTMTRDDGEHVYFLDSKASEAYIASLPDSDNRTKRPLPWAIETPSDELERTLTSRVPTVESK